MKKSAKTKDILAVYNIIKDAKYTKMDDTDKIKAWKISRALKPIATKLDEDSKDAAEKLRPEGEFEERLKKAQEYERLRNEKKPTIDVMTPVEYDAFLKEFMKYNENVNNAVKEFGDKEVEVEFEALSEGAFGKLMASNDWTMQQVTIVGDFIC